MRKLYVASAIIFSMLAGVSWAIVPPQAANQNIGAYDTSVNQLVKTNCRNRHTADAPDRHHNLVQIGEYLFSSFYFYEN